MESCLRSIIFWKDKAAKAEDTEPTLESRFVDEKIVLTGEHSGDRIDHRHITLVPTTVLIFVFVRGQKVHESLLLQQ